MSADEIVEDFPQLTHADVYAALAYYWDNKDELDRKIAEDDAYVEEMMRMYPGRFQEQLKQTARWLKSRFPPRRAHASRRGSRPSTSGIDVETTVGGWALGRLGSRAS